MPNHISMASKALLELSTLLLSSFLLEVGGGTKVRLPVEKEGNAHASIYLCRLPHWGSSIYRGGSYQLQ